MRLIEIGGINRAQTMRDNREMAAKKSMIESPHMKKLRNFFAFRREPL